MAKITYDSDTGQVEVLLSSLDMGTAAQVAKERHATQRQAGRFDWKASPDADGALNDYQGLLGEIAVKYAFGYEPKDHVAVLPITEWLKTREGLTDVAGMEVRAVARRPGDRRGTSLIVKHDKDAGKLDVPFILVRLTETDAIGQYAHTVRLVGWTYGKNAFKKNEVGNYLYWREEGVDRPNFFVPEGKLSPMSSLYASRGIPLPRDKFSDLHFGV